MEFPSQLKVNRERLGISQEELARRVFVSRQTISNWETGKTYPDVQSLLLLGSLFGVSIDELLKGDMAKMDEMVSKDAVRMERLSWGMVLLMCVGLACMAGFSVVWEEPSFIPRFSCGFLAGMGLFLVFWALALVCAFRIERIKKDRNLVTYREISAFMEGEEVAENPDAFTRKHPVRSALVKFLCGAAVGVVVAAIVVAFVEMAS